jgi:hypothetical protein
MSDLSFSDNVELIDPERDEKWDTFVDSHPHGWITHLSGWKQVMGKSFKQLKGYYLALPNDDKKSYRAALPLFEVNSWLTGNKLVSTPFATLSDPLVTDGTDLDKLIKAAQLLKIHLKSKYIEIRAFHSLPQIDDERLVPHCLYKHHYIELDSNPDLIKAKFHRSCVRQRINRAIESGLNLVTGTDEQSLKQFYKLYILTRKRLMLPPQPYVFIKSLWETFAPSGKMSLLLAELNGQVVAGLILLKYKDRVSAEFSVLNESYHNVSPIHLLFWEAIKSASLEGYKLFDFGRTDPNNTNLMEFKSRWGTKVLDIRHFQHPGCKDLHHNKEQTISYNIVKNISKISPDFIFELMGKFCYRHLY